MNRRSAMRVKHGRVQKKNNWKPDHGDIALPQDEIRIERKAPGEGWRHVLTVAQLRRFISILPDWEEVAIGINAIVIDRGRDDAMGWYDEGVVALCAWPAHSGFWHETGIEFLQEAEALLSLLEVQIDEQDGHYGLLWTEPQARAFMLLDVLPHELGHHRDLMTTRSKRACARGEPYAEAYAREVLEAVWPAYIKHFEV